MFDAAVIVLRWVQMTGAMILFGSSLFFLYGLPRTGPDSAAGQHWARPMLLASAAAVLVASLLGLLAQTVALAGSVQDGLTPDALGAAVTQMSFGKSSCARAVLAGFAIAGLAVVRPGAGAWRLTSVLGADHRAQH